MIDPSLIQPLAQGRFRFACRKALPCFTRCCANLDLALSPYDVLRLKNRIGLSSEAFLEKYTTVSINQAYGLPLVRLKMIEDKKKRCPFVTPDGCEVYEDRPGACRIYPLGLAASKIRQGYKAGEYYFAVREPHCLGFKQDVEWTVQEWIKNQGLDEYNAMNDLFMDIIAGKSTNTIKALDDRKLRMFYMACYSLDDFRRFIFETTFLDKFDISPHGLTDIRTNDTELMRLACDWLRFALFGEKTIHLQPGPLL